MTFQVVGVVKKPPASAGDVREVGSMAGLGRSPEEGMATPTIIPAWRKPMTEEPGRLQAIESQSQTQPKWLSMHAKDI